MRKSRFTEEQKIRALKEREKGRSTAEICRELGITEHTFYRWRSKYGGMEVQDARRLKELEDENRRLKKLVAEYALDKEALKAALEKKY